MTALARLVRDGSHVVWETAREAWWVVRCLPRLVLLLLTLSGLLLALGDHLHGGMAGLGLGAVLAWPRLHYGSWLDVTDRATARCHRRYWAGNATAVGLSVHTPGSTRVQRRVPRLLRKGTTCLGGVATLRFRLAAGQTLDDVDRAAPALAALLGGHSVRVAPDGPTRAVVTLALRDLLAHPTHTPSPGNTLTVGSHPLQAAPIGRTLTGEPWTVDARAHTLVAGMTGAGKASVMWSLLVGLAPAVRTGLVRLVGVDLKAGMELTHAAGMFSALATTPEQAVAILEREADLLAKRADRMAGIHRCHEPTPNSPHVLVVVDELAALTAYISDPMLRRRADTALRLLLTQGRAPGVSVWAWVQDPRKDTVPMRNLFPQMVGLRLKDAFETEMVLGEAATRTAPCHRIDPRHPGTGYAITEDGTATKVRAHYAPDQLIHHVARDYPTVHRLPAVSLAPAPDPVAALRSTTTSPKPSASTGEGTGAAPSTTSRPSQRRPRKPRAPRASTRATATTGGDAA
jgi:DNA segregation ATPase FtsK/SpoIIIE, S-DNA-T family